MIKNPSSLRDFCFISFVGSLYKLVDKVLAKRLGSVMDKLISLNQSIFLKGRLLVDGFIDVNQLINLVKRTKKVCLIFKVDLEKEYDSVNQSFFGYMLIIFDFNEKWKFQNRACAFVGNLSVLVNVSLTHQVEIQ